MVQGVVFAITLLTLATCSYSFPEKTDKSRRISDVIDEFDNLHSAIFNLERRVRSLDADIADVMYEAEDCSVGVNNAICTGGDIDSIMTLREKVNQVGKRSSPALRPVKAKRLVQNLSLKRYMLAMLKKYLHDVAEVFREDRKRSCNLNLGFHCQTDEYADFADMYDFLKSGISPGKRKRSTTATLSSQPAFP